MGFCALLLMAYIGMHYVSTAANTVPPTRAGIDVLPVIADEMKPVECAALRPILVVRGSGSIKGTKGNDLLLGSPGRDDLDGRDGNDCIVGGSGNDDLDGGGGLDVCIGGPGRDSFRDCFWEID
jgi:hypothetical protein